MYIRIIIQQLLSGSNTQIRSIIIIIIIIIIPTMNIIAIITTTINNHSCRRRRRAGVIVIYVILILILVFCIVIWGFPKIRGTILGIPIIRTVIFGGLYWGSLILGKYHIHSLRPQRRQQWQKQEDLAYTLAAETISSTPRP